MAINIIRGDSKRIDFFSPMNATKEQEDALIEFLKSIYEPTIVEETIDVTEPRAKRLGEIPRPTYPKWSHPEYTKLLDFDIVDEFEMAKQIGRTPTAIYMRRGSWVAHFMRWAGDRDIYANTPELVGEFMRYLEEENVKRREHKKRDRIEIKRLKSELSSLEATLKIQQEMTEKYPDRKTTYDEAILETMAKIELIKIELEKYEEE